VTGAPAPLCESCRYPCRYIDAHRRRSDPGNFDKVQNVFSAMSAGYKAMTQLSVHPFDHEISETELKQRLVSFAHEIGFDSCRVAACGFAPHAHEFRNWLGEGGHGEMSYMERGEEKRCDPEGFARWALNRRTCDDL